MIGSRSSVEADCERRGGTILRLDWLLWRAKLSLETRPQSTKSLKGPTMKPTISAYFVGWSGRSAAEKVVREGALLLWRICSSTTA